jgi:hypothetical protein
VTESFDVVVNGRTVRVRAGTTAAAAIALAGLSCCRVSVTGQPRAAVCGIGTCFECRAEVDGIAHAKTCQILCRPGMAIRTDAS